jgi:hypothetical protein
MPSLVRLWSHLASEVRGTFLIAVATGAWLFLNYHALRGLQHIEHDLVQGLHFILHLAFLGFMVWVEMWIGDFVARWSGAEFVSKIRRKALLVGVALAILVFTAGYVICFGLCKDGACREGLAKALMNPPYQPSEWYVIAIVVLCTFLLRGYAWAMHHAEIQHAVKSASRRVPPRRPP